MGGLLSVDLGASSQPSGLPRGSIPQGWDRVRWDVAVLSSSAKGRVCQGKMGEGSTVTPAIRGQSAVLLSKQPSSRMPPPISLQSCSNRQGASGQLELDPLERQRPLGPPKACPWPMATVIIFALQAGISSQ
jgi:hypothetical protein